VAENQYGVICVTFVALLVDRWGRHKRTRRHARLLRMGTKRRGNQELSGYAGVLPNCVLFICRGGGPENSAELDGARDLAAGVADIRCIALDSLAANRSQVRGAGKRLAFSSVFSSRCTVGQDQINRAMAVAPSLAKS